MLNRLPLPAAIETPLAEILRTLPGISPDEATALQARLDDLKRDGSLTAGMLAIGIATVLESFATAATEGGANVDDLRKIARLTGSSASASHLLNLTQLLADAIDETSADELDGARFLIGQRLASAADEPTKLILLAVGEAMSARLRQSQGNSGDAPAGETRAMPLSAVQALEAGNASHRAVTVRMSGLLAKHVVEFQTSRVRR